jgi:chromosome segregation ATPase
LGEATRELATLRAANAKMRAERASPPKPAAASFKPDPTDEKLSSSLKSYVSFKEEVANIFSEIDRVKQENAGLSSSLKAAVEQADQARATMARLEKEMRAEQRSRQEAEKTVAELREQLRAVARAVSAAGLSVDKLTTNAESAGKRD